MEYKKKLIKNGLFYGCSSLKSLSDISKWELTFCIDLCELFYGCSTLISLPDISKWNIFFASGITNIDKIFDNCKNILLFPDISKWKVFEIISSKKIFKNSEDTIE